MDWTDSSSSTTVSRRFSVAKSRRKRRASPKKSRTSPAARGYNRDASLKKKTKKREDERGATAAVGEEVNTNVLSDARTRIGAPATHLHKRRSNVEVAAEEFYGT